MKDTIYNILPYQIQNYLVSLYGKHLYKKRYSSPFIKILDEIEKTHFYSKEEIEELQFKKLLNILKHAEMSIPYYSNLFKKINLNINKFQDLNDLEKIPLLEKESIRKNPSEFSSINPKYASYIQQNTSGSTGKPLSLNVDEYTYKLAMALLVHHEQLCDVKFGKPRATFAGRMLQKIDNNNPPFCRYNKAENQLIFSSYHLNEKNISSYLFDLNRFSPEEIIGYPSAIYNLAYYIQQSNIPLLFTPKVIITNSESLLDWQRETIEAVFSCPVRDYYGTAEYVVFSHQCNQLNYHINPLIGLLDVVDNTTSSISNTEGDVICTTLSNYSMPLIRYKIGDRAIKSSELCSCGIESSILTKVIGRIDDYIITLDGRKIGRIDHIYKGLTGIKEAQVIQLSSDTCLINIVQASSGTKLNTSDLIKNFEERVGKEMNLKIKFIDKIKKGKNGKFKSVINEYIQ